MALIAGIDIETTGLDPASDEIIEVGIVEWDTDTNMMINSFSHLFPPENGQVPEAIENITGIKTKYFQSEPRITAQKNLLRQTLEAHFSVYDFIVAHNTEFERGFLSVFGVDTPKEKWIDTMVHIPGHQGKSLTLLAADHGILNPMPHRALPDCLVMMAVLSKYPFEEIKRYAFAEKQRLAVRFPFDESGKLQAAIKALGFRWSPEYKHWYKDVCDFEAEREMETVKQANFIPQFVNR